jgi:hypothetical protein
MARPGGSYRNVSSLRETPEDVAGRVVSLLLGGDHTINDTGSEPGQYDVHIVAGDGRTVAMEVTSFGADDWKETRAAIEARQKKGEFHGDGLQHQGWVLFPTGTRIRPLERPLIELLSRLEAQGLTRATSRYDGEDRGLQEIAAALAELGVSSADVWQEEPPEDVRRILLSQTGSGIGTAGALPAAITALFDKRDNHEKLARADCDERHLYAMLEEHGSGAVLEGLWPLPQCPSDPARVINVLWVWSPSVSGVLFIVEPVTSDWQRFNSVDGTPLPRALVCKSRPAPAGRAVKAQGHPRAIFQRAIENGNSASYHRARQAQCHPRRSDATRAPFHRCSRTRPDGRGASRQRCPGGIEIA